MADDLAAALAQAAMVVDDAVARVLHPDDTVIPEAMRYALGGGKCLRGFLVLEGARLHGAGEVTAAPVAASIESIHAYSLVHDDLPCMDDDDLRRGQPTVHRKWDEATAVLAGDALQALAFELLLQADIAEAHKLRLAHRLAVDAGSRGMVGGQAADIAAEEAEDPLSLVQIEALQARKTGALIEWAAAAGPRMIGADETALLTYGTALGRAFQISDDILDVEGDAAQVGKAVGKDARAGKATFISHLGLEGAKKRAGELVDAARDALHPYGDDADRLHELARFVVTRRK